MKREYNKIFVFDLDGTLGVKQHFYTEIAKENLNFIKLLSESGNLVCFATDRPKSLALEGMYLQGLTEKEIGDIFPIKIYEDGLFVEAGQNVKFNALDYAHPAYKKLKKIAFSKKAIEFFATRGFSLSHNSAIKNKDGKFLKVDYEGNELEEIQKNIIPVYRQNNIVRETYKFPDRFFPDIESLKHNVGNLNSAIIDYFTQEIKDWKEGAQVKPWLDSIDIYPKIDNLGKDRKAVALSNILKDFKINKDTKMYVCCDGENDIPLIEWASKFREYQIICPSNLKKGLKEYFQLSNIKPIILKESCENLYEGLGKII